MIDADQPGRLREDLSVGSLTVDLVNLATPLLVCLEHFRAG
jgi:hypothetical protein